MNKHILLVVCATLAAAPIHAVTTLHSAAEKGNIHLIRKLLASGADINEARRLKSPSWVDDYTDIQSVEFEEEWGETPLFLACTHNQIEAVRLLIQCGADVNKKTSGFGETPLHKAVQCHNTVIIQELLSNGADANVRSNCGRTPLHVAALYNNHEAVPMLVAARANVNDKSVSDETPLMVAIRKKNQEVELALRNAGAASLSNEEEAYVQRMSMWPRI